MIDLTRPELASLTCCWASLATSAVDPWCRLVGDLILAYCHLCYLFRHGSSGCGKEEKRAFITLSHEFTASTTLVTLGTEDVPQ